MDFDFSVENIMLKTIEFPKKLVNLSDGLPESQYLTKQTSSKKLTNDEPIQCDILPKQIISSKRTVLNKKRVPSEFTSREYSQSNILPINDDSITQILLKSSRYYEDLSLMQKINESISIESDDLNSNNLKPILYQNSQMKLLQRNYKDASRAKNYSVLISDNHIAPYTNQALILRKLNKGDFSDRGMKI